MRWRVVAVVRQQTKPCLVIRRYPFFDQHIDTDGLLALHRT
jgi:hypothetical protein